MRNGVLSELEEGAGGRARAAEMGTDDGLGELEGNVVVGVRGGWRS